MRGLGLAGTVLALSLGFGVAGASAAEPVVTPFPVAGQAAMGPIAGTSGSQVAALARNALFLLAPGTASPPSVFSGSSGYPRVPANDLTSGPDGALWIARNAQVVRQPVFPFSDAVAIPVIGVPAGTPITDVAPGPDGNTWFVAQSAGAVGVANDGVAPLQTGLTNPVAVAACGPKTVCATAQGNPPTVLPSIVRLSTGLTGQPEFFTAGLPASAKPAAITRGPDGNMWFTDAQAPKVYRFAPDGTITGFDAAPSQTIVAGPDGKLWLSGGSTITTDGVFTPRTLPADTLTVGPDGNLWGAQGGVVSRLGLGGQQFANPKRITVPATGDSGKAGLYPSPITVSGLQGTVTKVTARLNGVHHRFANDLQVMLVGPGGQSTVLMASVSTRSGDAVTQPSSLAGESIAFSAGAPAPARQITSGVFSPIDPGFALSFVAPAPALPTGGLGQFAGTNPNGTWNLFVVDSDGTAGTTGVLAGGWSLDVETTGPPPAPPPGAETGPGPTAAPAPDTGPTAAATPTPSARDTTRPRLTVTGVPARTTLRTLRRGLRVRVTPSERVRLNTALAIRTSRAGFGTPLLTRTRELAAPATLVLAPRIAARPKGRFQARLRLVATDPAGNRATVTRTITVRP